MIVKEIFNEDEIKKVICHPVIYEEISGDNRPGINDFKLPLSSDIDYIGGYVNGEIIALMVYHDHKLGKECHIQILPEFRRKYAVKFAEQSLLFRGTQDLYAEIPTLYKNVLNFALSNGFEIVGEIKNNHIKKGIAYDTKVLRFNDGICK